MLLADVAVKGWETVERQVAFAVGGIGSPFAASGLLYAPVHRAELIRGFTAIGSPLDPLVAGAGPPGNLLVGVRYASTGLQAVLCASNGFANWNAVLQGAGTATNLTPATGETLLAQADVFAVGIPARDVRIYTDVAGTQASGTVIFKFQRWVVLP